MMNKGSIFKCTVAVLISEAAGAIGAIFTMSSIPTWYVLLQKPAFTPPDWIFGPVWTSLFLLMGVAAFLIWEEGLKNKHVRIALGIFTLQLILNTLWSFLFFGLQNPWIALIEIAFLWVAIASTLLAFYRLNRTAGLLLVPYLLWVSFAAYLNYCIWTLNV